MAIWYRLRGRLSGYCTVEARNIIKATAAQVQFEIRYAGKIEIRREAKHGRYHSWHPTFEEAKQSAIHVAEAALESAERGLRFAHNNVNSCRVAVDDARAMVPPPAPIGEEAG